MEMFKVRIGVSADNGVAPIWVDVDVPTRATHTVLPDKLLRERLGIQPTRYRTYTRADGSDVRLPVGTAWIHFEGDEAPTTVIFGNDDEYRMGMTTLHVLALVADTDNQRLAPAPRLTL